MARLARVVAAGVPHHVTQRGNRRQVTFFNDEDFRVYIDLMATWCAYYGVAVWAYFLMSNHVHPIAVPQEAEGLAAATGEAHRHYSRHINFREGWRGHLWQGRFASFPMDESYLLAAARYVERNPVAAGIVKAAENYPWSSARAHLSGQDDGLIQVVPLLEIVSDWSSFLDKPLSGAEREAFLSHERTGRPLGGESLYREAGGFAGAAPEEAKIRAEAAVFRRGARTWN